MLSWSMAKSITHACLRSILVEQGRLDPMAATVPEWTHDDDPRASITLDHLLRMVDGLDFTETYALPEHGEQVAFSHCIDMLFGAGKGRGRRVRRGRPPAHHPARSSTTRAGR
ncbi:MAG: hypothetical protein R2695_15235 [Acidimicrobiales bacterium]